ncbi:MAG: metal-sensitive transcriptional regulator [Actinobacteria bacterium]|nr:metal-sensitive transcriptional regulator [Actinomycetota bacterium]
MSSDGEKVFAGGRTAPRRSGSSPSGRASRGYASGKQEYLIRLRKIEGQVRGLQRLIEEDAWCPDVVVQVASATRALQEVALGLLNDHLGHCVLNAARGPDGASGELAEVVATIRQVMRL